MEYPPAGQETFSTEIEDRQDSEDADGTSVTGHQASFGMTTMPDAGPDRAATRIAPSTKKSKDEGWKRVDDGFEFSAKSPAQNSGLQT
ncbi:MAG: hypothetical protein M1830_000995 [Pleopsidium flavum]|nr:MAG: hypothetical protein M1830_000995 [Pleopsidium flavum]